MALKVCRVLHATADHIALLHLKWGFVLNGLGKEYRLLSDLARINSEASAPSGRKTP